jgi:hypothetical protein
MVDLLFAMLCAAAAAAAAAEVLELLRSPGLGDRAPSFVAEVALEVARDGRWRGRYIEYFCLRGGIMSALSLYE